MRWECRRGTWLRVPDVLSRACDGSQQTPLLKTRGQQPLLGPGLKEAQRLDREALMDPQHRHPCPERSQGARDDGSLRLHSQEPSSV